MASAGDLPPDGTVLYPWAFVPPAGQTRGGRGPLLWQTGGTQLPTAATTCLVMTALTYCAGLVIQRRWRPQLSHGRAQILRRRNERRAARQLPAVSADEAVRDVARFASIAVVGAPFWAVFGPLAWYHGVRFSAEYPSEHPLNFGNDPAAMSEADLRLHNGAVLCGELFMGHVWYLTVMCMIGWDSGIDTLVHHVVFILITLPLTYAGSLCKLGIWAIAMETSTPPLYAVLVFRQVAGRAADGTEDPQKDHWMKMLFGPVFGILFLLLRVAAFGWMFWETVFVASAHWQNVFPATAHAMPATHGVPIIALFGAGWLMQLYWSRPVVAALTALLRGGKDPGGLSEQDSIGQKLD